jgi:hypothetical protein
MKKFWQEEFVMTAERLAALQPYLGFVHPIMMWMVLLIALYAMYLGIQTRRTRTAGSEQKSTLIKKRFPIRHHQMGAILLVLLVLGMIGGLTVTYLTRGEIVVGPHLFVGLAMVGVAATATGLVPFMQKQDGLRNVHVALNLVLMGLFGWQALTGVQIVQKMLSQL